MAEVVNDLKKYRLAKKLVEDLEKINVIMEQTKKDLKPYFHYYPVRQTLENLISNHDILLSNLKRQKIVVNNKGSMDNGTKTTIKA